VTTFIDVVPDEDSVDVDEVSIIVGVGGQEITVSVDSVVGPGATVAIGDTTTGAPGSPASVVNVGTPTSAVLDFTIPRGRDGASGSAYVFEQQVSAAVWGPVTHALGGNPAVTVTDTANTTIEGLVDYLDTNTASIKFNSPVSGTATFIL
jgi:hypothetical protein